MTIKRRKMVELQFFLQIADMVSGSKQKSNVSDRSTCESIKIC